MTIKERTNQVKAHLKQHKAAYITGGVCLVIGVAGSTTYFLTKPDIVQVARQINVLSPGSKQHVLQFIERSTPSKPIHLKGTQQYFDSISAAARETGLDRVMISKHLAGQTPDVKGSVFELVDVMS